ncbi:MAG: hypothetical protein WCW13_02365 [archaeon]
MSQPTRQKPQWQIALKEKKKTERVQAIGAQQLQVQRLALEQAKKQREAELAQARIEEQKGLLAAKIRAEEQQAKAAEALKAKEGTLDFLTTKLKGNPFIASCETHIYQPLNFFSKPKDHFEIGLTTPSGGFYCIAFKSDGSVWNTNLWSPKSRHRQTSAEANTIMDSIRKTLLKK